MTARSAMVAGARSLWVNRGATAAVLLAGATAGLAERAAIAAAGRTISLPNPSTWGQAAFLWLFGTAIAALVGAGALAAGIAAAAGERAVLRGAVRRGVAVLSLRAVEEVILGTVALAALAPSLRVAVLGRGAGISAAAVAVACAAPIAVSLVAVPAFRVAQVRAAEGEVPALALADGVEIALRRLPALVRFGVFAALVTAPFWALAALLGPLAEGGAAGVAIAVAAVRGTLILAAFLWSYAGLSKLIRVTEAVEGGSA
jgi:hypothetical protein